MPLELYAFRVVQAASFAWCSVQDVGAVHEARGAGFPHATGFLLVSLFTSLEKGTLKIYTQTQWDSSFKLFLPPTWRSTRIRNQFVKDHLNDSPLKTLPLTTATNRSVNFRLQRPQDLGVSECLGFGSFVCVFPQLSGKLPEGFGEFPRVCWGYLRGLFPLANPPHAASTSDPIPTHPQTDSERSQGLPAAAEPEVELVPGSVRFWGRWGELGTWLSRFGHGNLGTRNFRLLALSLGFRCLATGPVA